MNKFKTNIFFTALALCLASSNGFAQNIKNASTAFKLRGAKISYYYDNSEKKLYEINSPKSCRRIHSIDTSSGKPQHKVNANSFSQTFTLNLDETPPNVRIDSSVRGNANTIPIEILPCINGDCKGQSFKTCD